MGRTIASLVSLWNSTSTQIVNHIDSNLRFGKTIMIFELAQYQNTDHNKCYVFLFDRSYKMFLTGLWNLFPSLFFILSFV